MFHVKHEDDMAGPLFEELSALGINLERPLLESCLEHWHLIVGAAGSLNLISRSDIEAGPIRHIGDSLAFLARWIPSSGDRMLDVGSGGGFPGIPIALAVPDLTITLLESRERKAEWLIRVVYDLGLSDRVSVLHKRFEDYHPADVGRFDFITARALASPADTIKLILPVLGEGSKLIIWHSEKQVEKMKIALSDIQKVGVFAIEHTISYQFKSINFSSCITGIYEVC